MWSPHERVRFVYLSDDPFSQLVYNHRGFELRELGWCEAWLGPSPSCIVDCGANIGWFSAWLAQRLPRSKVLAVEGNRATAARAAGVFARLGLDDRIRLANQVLADGGPARWVVPDLAGREAWQRAEAAKSETVPNTFLDALVSSHQLAPDLIKIDCEGFEVRILRGAVGLLAKRNLVWMIECNKPALQSAGTSATELFEIMQEYGYLCRHIASFDRDVDLGVPVDAAFESLSFNFAAIPDEPEFLAHWENTCSHIR